MFGQKIALASDAVEQITSSTVRLEKERNWALPNLRDIWRYRDLLSILAIRDIKVRYKQTWLGVLWVVLQPLLSSSIFAVIFGRFAKLPSDGVDYLLFVYVGMMPWNLFSSSVSRASNSLLGSMGLISKVYFPRIILPFSSVLSGLLDFAIGSSVIVLLLALDKVTLSLNLLALPFFLLLTIILSIGVGTLIAALSVRRRDLLVALPFLMQVLMYTAPLVYSSSIINNASPDSRMTAAIQAVFQLNPLNGIITGVRWSLIGTPTEFPWLPVGFSCAISVICFVLGLLLFRHAERTCVDMM